METEELETDELEAVELEAADELDALPPPQAVRPMHMASMPTIATTTNLFFNIRNPSQSLDTTVPF